MINWGPCNNDDDDTFLDSHNPMDTKQNGCSEEQANSMTCEKGLLTLPRAQSFAISNKKRKEVF